MHQYAPIPSGERPKNARRGWKIGATSVHTRVTRNRTDWAVLTSVAKVIIANGNVEMAAVVMPAVAIKAYNDYGTGLTGGNMNRNDNGYMGDLWKKDAIAHGSSK